MAFVTLALAQVVHTFNARSQHASALTGRLFTNEWLWSAVVGCVFLQVSTVYVPFLQSVLHTVALVPLDWMVIAGCALSPVAVVEVVKRSQRGLARTA
jgi:Ca2+-transporting ATPase